jgi:NitT/TauT family transport system permease protein
MTTVQERAAVKRAVRRAPRTSIWLVIPRPISILGFVGLLILAWWGLTEAEVVDPFILPPPNEVGVALVDVIRSIIEGGIIREAFLITVAESVMAFGVAVVLGLSLGFLVAESVFGRVVMLPFLVAVNAAPKVVFAPVFIAALGFGMSAKVALGAFIAFFPLLVDTAAGLASVDRDKATLFRSLRANRRQRFLKLQLPASLPFVFAGMKTASVLAVIGAVIGEFLGGGKGLGQQTKIAGDSLAMDRVYAYGIILALFGYLFYAAVAYAERKIVFWQSPHGGSHTGG